MSTLLLCGMASIVIGKDFMMQFIKKEYSFATTLTNMMIFYAIILMIVCNFLILSNKKNNKRQKTINKLLTDIENINKNITKTITNCKKPLNEKIKSLNHLIAQKQNMISTLNTKIDEAKREEEEHNKIIDGMTSGVQTLYYILNQETDLKLDKKDILNFIACYKLIDASFMEEIDDGEITPKEEFFCILHRLNKTPEEIRLILNISKDAYRQLKHRTLKHLQSIGNSNILYKKIQEDHNN